MKTNVWKRLLAVFVVLQMSLAMAVPALAVGEGDDDEIVGSPQIVLVNGPVFEASAGQVNEITLKLRNNSSYGAHSIVIQPVITDVAESPFSIEFKNNSNKITQINTRAETNVTMLLDVDKTAASKTYSITLNYTYYNKNSVKSTGSDTMYVKIVNKDASPNFALEELKTNPAALSAGGSATLNGVIRNIGPLDMYDVNVSLEGLTPEGISVSGVNGKNFASIIAGTRQDFGFNIVAGNAVASGNYPVTVKLTYADYTGKTYELKQEYYVNVGGVSGSAKLEIQNMKEPAGDYGVNDNFTVSFDLVNTGASKINGIKVTAAPSDADGGVVPKSTSIETVDSLEAGAKVPMSFTFAATASAKPQNYAISFTVEYNGGASFTQYAGVNVNGAGATTSKPKIIVSEYSCDPIIVMAGEEFNLDMTFLNTHAQKDVKNVKMFLTMVEETSTNDTKTGNIFTPVDSSNTFYFDAIPAKGTVSKVLRLYTLPDAQPKTYTLTVNFEYEDDQGTEYTATELLGINVKQPTEISVGDIYVPESIEAGMPVYLSFELYNTGKVQVSNLMVNIEGSVTAAAKSTYLGNFASGDIQYYDGSFTAYEEGSADVNVLISYDDPSGEHIEVPHEFTMQVTAPYVPELDENGNPIGMDDMGMEPMPSQGPSWKLIVGILAAVIIVIVIIIVVLKKRKAKAETKFLEEADEADEAFDGDADEELNPKEVETTKGKDTDERS